MKKPDMASGAISVLAAVLIVWILAMLSRTSEALALLDGRLASLESRRGSTEEGGGRTAGGSAAGGAEDAMEQEMSAMWRELREAAFVQDTLTRSATSRGSSGIPRTYPDLVKSITANLADREQVARLERAKKSVETHVQLAAQYSNKLTVGLKLDPEQEKKVLEIVRDHVRAYEPILALETIGEEALAEVARIDDETDQRILAELKPEQAAKYADVKRPWLAALVHRSGSR